MISEKKIFGFNAILLTNLLFSFFPISFIIGNFATNLNTVLFCFLGLFLLKSKIIQNKFDVTLKFIFSFFILVIFSTALSVSNSLYVEGYNQEQFLRLIKSISFLRFFLLMIIVYYLSSLKILDFKYFFISAAFFSLFISVDVIIQYIFGFNLIGMKWDIAEHARHFSSFFGDELISGGFIQNFSFFAIFYAAFLLKEKKNISFLITVIIICVLGISILLSGNRMSLILFILGLLLIFLFNDEFKKKIFFSLVALTIIFALMINFDIRLKDTATSYYNSVKNILVVTLKNTKKDESQILAAEEDKKLESDFDFFWPNVDEGSGYIKLFLTAIDTWKENKVFGNGIKSFREDCVKFRKYKENRLCSNHPHNYYLEILTELGLVGLFLVSILAFLFFYFIFKNFKIFKESRMENLILLAATISLILEAFPIKSSGSVFSTNNSTYLIILSSIFISYKKILINEKVNRGD